MDRVLFLDSRGGILSKYPNLRSEEPLPVVPYVEQVDIPVVSVDPRAVYGAHPEDLATLTFSSGGALTFFCDSVAGGVDSRGDGSFEHPWRSLDRASKFLSCHAPLLKRAAPYIQLKIKGTVDYISGRWQPFGAFRDSGPTGAGQLILTGWDETCDLAGHPSANFAAGYMFDLRVRAYGSALIAASNCDLISAYASESFAADCRFLSGARVFCACNCSADMQGPIVSAYICRGGSYRTRLEVSYACGTTVDIAVSGERWGGNFGVWGMYVSSAAADLAVSVKNTAWYTTYARCIDCPGDFLGNCTVTASAVAAPCGTEFDSYTAATANFGNFNSATVIRGGRWTAYASASALAAPRPGDSSGTRYAANADARVYGFGNSVTVHSAGITLTAGAGAVLQAPDGDEYERELIFSNGVSSWESRARYYSGGVMYDHWESSGRY